MANILFIFLSPTWRVIIHSIIQCKILGFKYITLSPFVSRRYALSTETQNYPRSHIRNTPIECTKRVCMFELDIYLDIY